MKKAITIILVLMLMASCSMTIRDPEGWEIYQVGWTLEEGTVLIQSHDGFRWGEYLLNETIKQTPVEIHNVLDRVIKVKITLPQIPSYWLDIAPLSSIMIQTLTQSGGTWGAWTAGTRIPLNKLISFPTHGIVAQFASRVGHTINDLWAFEQKETRGLVIEDSDGIEFFSASDGQIICPVLPTSASGLPSGALWKDGTTVRVV